MLIQLPKLTDLYTTAIDCAWVRSGIRVIHLSAKVPCEDGSGWEVWYLIGSSTVFEIR